MKKIIAALLLLIQSAVVWADSREPVRMATIEAYFIPEEDCAGKIVREIGDAKEEILAQTFTSGPIAKELVAAHKRGVKVEAVLDKSQRSEKYTSATFLDHVGAPADQITNLLVVG